MITYQYEKKTNKQTSSRPSDMTASVYLFVFYGQPCAVECVKKLFWVHMGLKISAFLSMLHP